MDATLKRSMWKVAIAHFVLTVFVFIADLRFENEDYNQAVILAHSLINIFFLLQPLIWLVFEVGQIGVVDQFFSSIPDGVMLTIFLPLIPIWSLCFGWLFVKLDNWLNHFPVLGKRVL